MEYFKNDLLITQTIKLEIILKMISFKVNICMKWLWWFW